MKRKFLILFFGLLACSGFAQTVDDEFIARTGIWLNGEWFRSVTTDTTFWDDDSEAIATSEAIRLYVKKELDGFGSGVSGLTDDYLPKSNATGDGLEDSQIFDNGTNVGIGTPTPAAKLEIAAGDLLLGNDRKIRFRKADNTPYDFFSFDSADRGYLRTPSTLNLISDASTVNIKAASSELRLGAVHQYFFAASEEHRMTAAGLFLGSASGSSLLTVAGGGSIGDGYKGNAAPSNGLIVEGLTGLGTTAPSNMLHVQSTTLPQFKIGYSPALYMTMTNQGYFDIAQNGSIENHYRFHLDGTEHMRLNDAGNLGINDFDPQEKLHVNGNIQMNDVASGATWSEIKFYGTHAVQRLMFRDLSQTGDNWFGLRGGDSGVSWVTASDAYYLRSHTDEVLLRVGNNNGNSYFADAAGHVGIGISSPASLLHVRAGSSGIVSYPGPPTLIVESSSDASISMYSPDLSNSYLRFGSPGDDIGGQFRYSYSNNIFVLETANGSNSLAFGSGDQTEVMRLSNTGNVGIGTTSPTEKLEVNGSIKMVDGNEVNGRYMVSDANGVGSWQDFVGIDGTGGVNLLPYFTDANTLAVDSDFKFDGTTLTVGSSNPGVNPPLVVRYSISAETEISTNSAGELSLRPTSGEVGINTETPGGTLELLDDGVGSQVFLKMNHNGSPADGDQNQIDFANTSTTQARIASEKQGSTTDLFFYGGNGAAVRTDYALKVDGGTNDVTVKEWLGLGTEAPESILHIEDDFPYAVLRSTLGTSATRITFENEPDDADSWQLRRNANGTFAIGHGNDQPHGDEAVVVVMSREEFRTYTNSILIENVSAATASGLSVNNGRIVYVNTTDATFTSVGFWGVVNGSWEKLD